jgi:hypothetical protein
MERRISAATRAEITQAAKEMRYRSDPMIQALSVYRNATHPPIYHATLAWLVTDKRSAARPDYNFHNYFYGVQERAEELGCMIEEFLLRSPGMTTSIISGR